MKKKEAVAKFAAKAEEATKLAERVLLASREFHNAIIDLWDKENRTAISALHAALRDHCRIAYQDGDEIEGWSGNCIQQSDSVVMLLERFELLFGDFISK